MDRGAKACLACRSSLPARPSLWHKPAVRQVWVAAGRKAAKKQRKQSKAQPPTQKQLQDQVPIEVESIDMVLPPTAPPTSDYREQLTDDVSPQDVYPVFLDRTPKRNVRWKWDGEDDEPSEEIKAAWNPRTGFRNAEVDPPYEPQVDLLGLSSQADGELPLVTKNQVVQAALSTAAGFVVLAILIRGYAGQNAPLALGTDPALLRQLTSFPGPLPGLPQLGAFLGAVGAVTAARAVLLNVWPSFAEASNRSNKQVLTPLSTGDIILICCLAGFSEELLFRWAIIPATFPDWKGVAVSGAIFGALHTNGGRNLSFAAWAGFVGVLYGFLFLFTKNMLLAGTAHSLANMASAWLWWSKVGTQDTVKR